MAQAIPLTSNPNQKFQVTLLINNINVTFQFILRWNIIAGYWTMSITNLATGEILLDSIPLVTGYEESLNILRPYGYLEIGSAYLISKVLYPKSDFPNEKNMNEFIIVWGD